jgi:tetratricopeptide (TPR) repeat protein
MKIKNSLALFSLFVFFTGCATIQSAGDVQYGRQALLGGNNEAALGYFYSAAQRDPNYVYATGSSPKQSVWSYVGRSEYLTGRFPQAQQTLERVISGERVIAGIRQEDIARLYLGLTLAREGDRQRGLNEIESGMRGINNFLDYINQAQRFNIGQFWDVDRDIRRAIQSDLAMISGKDVDWQRLTADTEWLGIRMEQESDLARRQEAFENNRDSAGSPNR